MTATEDTLGHGFPPNIAMTAPALGAGEEAGGRAGWGCRLIPIWWKQGRGRPPPRQPHPNGDSHHGPLHEDMPTKKAVPRDKTRSGTNHIWIRIKTRIGFQQISTLRFYRV